MAFRLYKRGVLRVFAMVGLLSACAHAPPDTPKMDRSSGFNLAPIAAKFRFPRCRVSVPLTQAEALRYVGRWYVEHPEKMPDWIAMVEAIQPGDDLREVICDKKGHRGGVDYIGLFRDGTLVAEWHYVYID